VKPWLLLGVVGLAACESEPPAPVIVYASTELGAQLEEQLPIGDFAITIIAGDSGELTDRIIAKQDAPRADVLITSNAIDIWRAADEGALRPIDDQSLADVPAALKDPDGSWAALAHRQVLLGVAAGTDEKLASSLIDLGAPDMAGRLCLTSFRLVDNRALIGLLIDEMGVKPAERLVRSWVRNLAAAPFATESELLAALEGGDCQIGIVSGATDDTDVELIAPQPGYLLIDGIGISRHAENAEAAQRLVGRVLSDYQSGGLGESAMSNAGIAGWRSEDARLLAERAGYR